MYFFYCVICISIIFELELCNIILLIYTFYIMFRNSVGSFSSSSGRPLSSICLYVSSSRRIVIVCVNRRYVLTKIKVRKKHKCLTSFTSFTQKPLDNSNFSEKQIKQSRLYLAVNQILQNISNQNQHQIIYRIKLPLPSSLWHFHLEFQFVPSE